MSPEVAKAFEITKQVVAYVDSMPRVRANRVVRDAAPHAASEHAHLTWEGWARGEHVMTLVDLARISFSLQTTVSRLLDAAATSYAGGSAQASNPRRSPR